jgi:DNA-binding response OmpR family regulator
MSKQTGMAGRLSHDGDDFVLSFSDIEVNIDRGVVTRRGLPIDLTPAEFNLLTCFLLNAGRDLSRDDILESVWGYLPSPNTRTVDAHVLRLRKKLEPNPNTPRHFITLHKVGYRFCPKDISS